ncbi:hypothetical protein LX36DRAFT_657785 [Colletotrichum falcatum]|nr:hypothetical protein LX36DRAFT_657785 [Colletotrichum falcatum]
MAPSSQRRAGEPRQREKGMGTRRMLRSSKAREKQASDKEAKEADGRPYIQPEPCEP